MTAALVSVVLIMLAALVAAAARAARRASDEHRRGVDGRAIEPPPSVTASSWSDLLDAELGLSGLKAAGRTGGTAGTSAPRTSPPPRRSEQHHVVGDLFPPLSRGADPATAGARFEPPVLRFDPPGADRPSGEGDRDRFGVPVESLSWSSERPGRRDRQASMTVGPVELTDWGVPVGPSIRGRSSADRRNGNRRPGADPR